jgi:uncharacterized protein YcbK (DUF882 family)
MSRANKTYILVNVETGEAQKVPGNFRLQANFQTHELVTEDTQEVVLFSPTLMKYLQQLRDKSKGPINITGGQRQLKFNDKVGGSANSEHLTGHALDIASATWTQEQLYIECIEVGGHFTNVSMDYPRHVHFGVKGFHRRATK